MKVLLETLRPVDDDSNAIKGPPPVQLKAMADLMDKEDAYRPCQGVAVGFFLGSLLWATIIIAWLLLV